MKFKALLAVVILGIVVVSQAHSFGIGAQANFRAGDVFAPGASLLLSPADMAHLAFNWYINKHKYSTFGLTFDLVPVNFKIIPFGVGSFNFNLGVGLFANSYFPGKGEKVVITGGLRIPIGFALYLGKNFEVFTHVAPSFGVDFIPSFKLSWPPNYPIALGARLWIR